MDAFYAFIIFYFLLSQKSSNQPVEQNKNNKIKYQSLLVNKNKQVSGNFSIDIHEKKNKI